MDCYPWGENGRNIMDDFAEKSLWTWGNTIENFANLAQSSHSSFGGERHSEVRTPPSFAKEYFTHHWGIFSLQKCSSAIQVFLWKRLLCWARTGKVMLLSDAKSGGLSFWRTTGTMKYDEIWLNMMKYDEVFTCCELPPVVMCCFGQMWFFGTSDMLRIEQLQTLPPGLQMMLLNTEVEKTAGKSSETQRTLSRNSAKAIAGGYEERLIEAPHRGTTAPRHCAVNDPTPWWLDSNWFKWIQMDSNTQNNSPMNQRTSPKVPKFHDFHGHLMDVPPHTFSDPPGPGHLVSAAWHAAGTHWAHPHTEAQHRGARGASQIIYPIVSTFLWLTLSEISQVEPGNGPQWTDHVHGQGLETQIGIWDIAEWYSPISW